MKNTYVLRVKGKTRGHIFYDYLEDTFEDGVYLGCRSIGCEKMKYANEFYSSEEAKEFKEEYDKDDNFDIVGYGQAEEEYCRN